MVIITKIISFILYSFKKYVLDYQSISYTHLFTLKIINKSKQIFT